MDKITLYLQYNFHSFKNFCTVISACSIYKIPEKGGKLLSNLARLDLKLFTSILLGQLSYAIFVTKSSFMCQSGDFPSHKLGSFSLFWMQESMQST